MAKRRIETTSGFKYQNESSTPNVDEILSRYNRQKCSVAYISTLRHEILRDLELSSQEEKENFESLLQNSPILKQYLLFGMTKFKLNIML